MASISAMTPRSCSPSYLGPWSSVLLPPVPGAHQLQLLLLPPIPGGVLSLLLPMQPYPGEGICCLGGGGGVQGVLSVHLLPRPTHLRGGREGGRGAVPGDARAREGGQGQGQEAVGSWQKSQVSSPCARGAGQGGAEGAGATSRHYHHGRAGGTGIFLHPPCK